MIASLRESIERLSEIERNQKLLLEQIKQLVADRDDALERTKNLETFVSRFLDPEDLGYSVDSFIRDDAREALGRARVESPATANS
jgi:hypothetical protein